MPVCYDSRQKTKTIVFLWLMWRNRFEKKNRCTWSWPVVSPDHQQSWYWSCATRISVTSLGDITALRNVLVPMYDKGCESISILSNNDTERLWLTLCFLKTKQLNPNSAATSAYIMLCSSYIFYSPWLHIYHVLQDCWTHSRSSYLV